jgi:predicted Zn finger-like uncharacterized protein
VKISCPTCSAKYSIADEKVQDRLAKIRCRKCSATIVIDGKVNPPNVYATAGDTGDAAHAAEHHADPHTEYSVDFGEGDQRNLALADVVNAYNAGQLTAETYVWAEGFSDWKMVQEVPEIVEALSAGGRPLAAAAPAAARAAARPGRAGAADLFGRIESAGSEEEEVATSAPEPAPAAAAAPLGGMGGMGGGFGGSTGARNESSVLFSLSALTAGASKPSNTAQPSKPAADTSFGKEDSGVIDLKALTAAATKSDGGAAGMPAAPPLSPLGAPPLGVAAPLGLGSPLGGTTGVATAADLSMPQQKSKTGLFIAIAIVVAALVVSVAFILKPPAAPVPPPVETPVAAPTPTPTPTPSPELAAKPPSTGTAEEADAGKAPPKAGGSYKRPSGGAAAGKKPAGGAAEAPAEAPAAPPKKKNPCGCATGDLQCAMRCAAGG